MTTTVDRHPDYTTAFSVPASAEQAARVLTDIEEISRWWTSWTAITGSGEEGGQMRFSLPRGEDQLILRVAAARPTTIAWSVEDCAVQPEWTETRPTFTLRARRDGGTDIEFQHLGLTPAFECWDICQAGWDQHLETLRQHLGAQAPRSASTRRAMLGNHSAVRASRAERESIRAFYRDVLGGELVRELPDKEDLRLGDDFYLAFLYASGDGRAVSEGVSYAAEDALSHDHFRKAVFLELKTHNVDELRQSILDFGVEVLDVPDPHLYFQAPGGQVFRVVGVNEDLSDYEGTQPDQ